MEPKSKRSAPTDGNSAKTANFRGASSLDPASRANQSFTFSAQSLGGSASPNGTADAITIRLTCGYVALISAEDYERVSRHKWCASVKNGVPYAVRTARHGEHRYLHHFILDRKPGEWVDHHDGNTLNNTRGNLRRCTRIQNNKNKRKSAASTNPFKGIERRGNIWRAYIYEGKKRRWLGSFHSPDAAARAYDAKARELHGEFARLNFPEMLNA